MNYIKVFRQLTQYSTLTPIKSCKSCVYYVQKNIEEESLCRKFGKKQEDLVTYNNFLFAKDCRSDTNKCGQRAMYYISNLIK